MAAMFSLFYESTSNTKSNSFEPLPPAVPAPGAAGFPANASPCLKSEARFYRRVTFPPDVAVSAVAGKPGPESVPATTCPFTTKAARNAGAFLTGFKYSGEMAEGVLPSVVKRIS